MRRQEGLASQETRLSPQRAGREDTQGDLATRMGRDKTTQEQELPGMCIMGSLPWPALSDLSNVEGTWKPVLAEDVCGKDISPPPLFNCLRQNKGLFVFLIIFAYLLMCFCVGGVHTPWSTCGTFACGAV